jgi:hypothetical protein
MQTHFGIMHTRPTVALADYDFLRSTYEILLRAPVPNYTAINAAFEALEGAHERLQRAHEQLMDQLRNGALH